MVKKVDLFVLGATGFTGKHVVKNLALLGDNPEYDVTWGISGRSKDKLSKLLSEIEEWGIDVSKIPVVECDIKNPDAVRDVCQRTKVLMNATGPNTLLSEPIVRACIETGTHYVDISAELHHMLSIYRTHNAAAEKANVKVIPACGFASIPAIIGLIHLENNFKGTLNTVECYTVLDIPKRAYFPTCNNCLVHYGTWESLVFELHNFKAYSELKKRTFPRSENEPAEIKKCFFHRSNGRFWFPYPGPDHDIVETTQWYQQNKKGKRPYHFKSYTTMPLFIHFIFIVPAFFFYYIASYFKFFRYLLWKFPRFFTLGYFSHEGPSDRMRNDMKYSFTLTGKGWDDTTNLKEPPNKTLTLKVSGTDPGYQTTAISLIYSALTILYDGPKMPNGGVLTSGAAFNDTKIVERLISDKNIKFEIIES